MHRISRSAISTRKQCEMKRYLQYHLRREGVQVKGEKNLDNNPSLLVKVRGQLFHEISLAIIQGFGRKEWQDLLQKSSTDLGLSPLQSTLIRRAMIGWEMVRGKWWNEHFDVVSAEHAWSWPITPTIHEPLRMDKILKRKDDGRIGIFDYKTMGAVTPNWIEKMEMSDQTHLYIQALKERLEQPILGICYDGVILGKNVKGIQKSPFVTGYQKNGKISAVWSKESESIDLSSYPDEKWLEWILKHDKVLEELYCTTNFLHPQPEMLLHTKNSVGRAEEEFMSRVEMIEVIRETYGEHSPQYVQIMNLMEKNPEQCLKFGVGHACPFVLQCWQGFPIEDQFEPREDHHGESDEEND